MSKYNFTCVEDLDRIINGIVSVPAQPFRDSIPTLIDQSFTFKLLRNELEENKYLTKDAVSAFLSHKEKPIKVVKGLKAVPGYSIKSFVPQQSGFSSAEMQELFRIFISAKSEALTEEQTKILQAHSVKLNEEQQKYLSFASEQWTKCNFKKHTEIETDLFEFVNRLWKGKLGRIKEYPRFYSDSGSISLLSNTDIKFEFKKKLTSAGKGPKCYLSPDLSTYLVRTRDVFCQLNDESQEPNFDFSFKIIPNSLIKKGFKSEVSRDATAELLALSNDIGVVMSSSSWSTLIANHAPFSSNWYLPFIVKEHNSSGETTKTVVYFDKKLPPKAMSIVDRHKIYNKIALHFTLLQRASTLRVPEEKPVEIFDISTLETFGVDPGHRPLPNQSWENCEPRQPADKADQTECESDVSDDERLKMDIVDETDTVEKEPKKESEINVSGKTPKPEQKTRPFQVVYSQFELSPKEEGNIYMKMCLKKKFRVLIRSQNRGAARIGRDNLFCPCKLSAKLEYQTEYGAECASLHEISKEWASTVIMPNAILRRARIDPLTGEIIQIERKTAKDLQIECSRLHNVNLEDKVSIVYSVLSKVTELPPGNYLLAHSSKNGGFATVYKATDSNHTFNLWSTLSPNVEEVTSSRAPWVPLDTRVLTPTFRALKRLPCVFSPYSTWKKTNRVPLIDSSKKSKPGAQKRKKKKKKNVQKGKKETVNKTDKKDAQV